MRLALTIFLTLGVVTAGFVALNGCGSGTLPTYSYGGPGSAWTATLRDDGTFTITHADDLDSAVDLTVTGTYSRLTSGFVKLTVTGSVGADGPSNGDEAYGLEIPGFAFLLKPIGEDSNLIPMVATSACPTTNFALNWIVTDKEDSSSASSTSSDFFGTFAYNATTGVSTLPSKYALGGPYTSLGSGTIDGAAACADGIIEFTGGAIWLTSQGGALVHAPGSGPSNDQVIVAMPQTAITDTSSMGGEYAGLVFDKSESSGGRIYPVAATATETSGSVLTLTGTKITDVDTGTTSADSVTITTTALDSPSNGFIKATIQAGLDSGVMSCMAAKNVVSSGKNMLFCVSQSPGDNTKMFNLLLVSK
jgi:hypothetical protein